MAKMELTESFEKAISKVPIDIQEKAADKIDSLLEGKTGSIRLHRLTGFRPPLWKMDVMPNKSWQIVLEIIGDTYRLLDIATHKEMDRYSQKKRAKR